MILEKDIIFIAIAYRNVRDKGSSIALEKFNTTSISEISFSFSHYNKSEFN